jgi:tyrosyl-tRNA synthetase
MIMDVEKRLELIKQVGEEIITVEDLRKLLDENKHPVAYDGFEPSGRIHIAQGILRAINANKMTQSGCKFKFWVADWFAWMNNKMGGDLDKIRVTGDYFIEVWKSCGMDMDNVEFLWSKDVMSDDEYWKKVVNIARNSTVNRIVRCSQIMGRSENESLSAAQIFYPCMQCADIFHLQADIAQLGMDQRKVNMLAREVGDKLFGYKPVAVHHHMLMGLGQPPQTELTGADRGIALKMSKSIPDSAIFMTDSEEDIKRKINKAFCPEKQVIDNPLMDYSKYLIFEKFDKFKIERPAKFGGDIEFNSYEDLKDVYEKGNLHPMDLKSGVSNYCNKMLEPVRNHFEKNKKARDLLEQVKSFEITR